ncbi:MAG: hypothetical protein COW03_01145 [Cytophagales bacterium CG12_big_fil_rev_8_21_14_0_65_40_12]|nr:MAG: hypothetical protein COW03_01145 [Cytophagales bacterium CG12_big_fil_rev_8_21_14_0_65_40_12]PIW03890.1 MAG: hypothetical protein COW40_12045 [Cytophagales bacterium CG17_big_fil_post_rev_8_21_14_2_50_40_13]
MLSFGQEQEAEKLAARLLKADNTWGKELFMFPISFAQEINFKGVEVALFPKGWSNQESPEFWSYAFAWEVDADHPLTKTALESSLQLYFDGLLSIDNWKKSDASIQNTKVLLMEKEDHKSTSRFTGYLDIFESRYTKKRMTLNVTIEQHYCETNQKAIILFKFSPKDFDHTTWKKLAEVTLRKDLCK